MQHFHKSIKLILVVAFLTGIIIYLNPLKKSQILPQPLRSSGKAWTLVLNEDFNTIALNTKQWTTCYDWYSSQYHGCSNNGNHEMEWYTKSQVVLKNGNLDLTAIVSPTTGWDGKQEHDYKYKSGMISTGRDDWNATPKQEFTYGYFEARMKTTSGKGVWPAFWLLPIDQKWPPEIDIMEILGDKPNQVLLTTHWGVDSNHHQKDSTTFDGLANPNDWHTYAINWQPNKIEWFIDNKLVKTFSGNNVPNKPMELIINLAIGGDLPGFPDATTPIPASLLIDYVKVYRQN